MGLRKIALLSVDRATTTNLLIAQRQRDSFPILILSWTSPRVQTKRARMASLTPARGLKRVSNLYPRSLLAIPQKCVNRIVIEILPGACVCTHRGFSASPRMNHGGYATLWLGND